CHLLQRTFSSCSLEDRRQNQPVRSDFCVLRQGLLWVLRLQFRLLQEGRRDLQFVEVAARLSAHLPHDTEMIGKVFRWKRDGHPAVAEGNGIFDRTFTFPVQSSRTDKDR